MEYIYAALLLHSADKPIDEEGLTNVVEGTGEEPDTARIKALVAALDGVDIEEAIETAAVPAAAPAAAAPASAGGDEEAEEEAEDEEEDEASEEEAAEGLAGLFD